MLSSLIRRPELYLAIYFFLIGVVIGDSFRQTPDQVTAELYVRLVRTYQAIGRPMLKGAVACRFRPTCSEYSIEAVRTYGIRYGLLLTIYRIDSCRQEGTEVHCPLISFKE